MNKNILNTGAQDFISKNINSDIMSVLLKKSTFDEISSKELAEQIESKKKCLKKLPTWFKTPKVYYPNKLNIEQTSSEITAQYKARIVNGKSLVDLTGGFGIDSYYFSKKIDKIIYNELDQNLSEITAHNLDILGAKNIKVSSKDAIIFLKQSNEQFDWIYIDPSRRNKKKQKVFLLEDCLPNVTAHLELIFDKTDNVLLKTAPLLDISIGIKALLHVAEVHIVAVNNEVKELLWVLKKGFKDGIMAKTINFTKTVEETFNFKLSEEKAHVSKFEHPQTYLYEPNSAILKSGGFKIIAHQLDLRKLGTNTHLYTSKQLISFPGRRFRIEKVIDYTKANFKKLQLKKANITTRNFPHSVADIRKDFKINDGGAVYVFFTKNYVEKYQILVCSKV